MAVSNGKLNCPYDKLAVGQVYTTGSPSAKYLAYDGDGWVNVIASSYKQPTISEMSDESLINTLERLRAELEKYERELRIRKGLDNPPDDNVFEFK